MVRKATGVTFGLSENRISFDISWLKKKLHRDQQNWFSTFAQSVTLGNLIVLRRSNKWTTQAQ
jgi:hypothetical protein